MTKLLWGIILVQSIAIGLLGISVLHLQSDMDFSMKQFKLINDVQLRMLNMTKMELVMDSLQSDRIDDLRLDVDNLLTGTGKK